LTPVTAQPAQTKRLINLIRVISLALLVLFCLPWFTTWVGPMPVFSFVLTFASNVFQTADMLTLQNVVIIVGWLFIPFGSILLLVVSYTRHQWLPLLALLTGVLSSIPFIIMTLQSYDPNLWYVAAYLAMLCLVALVVIGVLLSHQTNAISPPTPF
jgi:hypothetical protein